MAKIFFSSKESAEIEEESEPAISGFIGMAIYHFKKNNDDS